MNRETINKIIDEVEMDKSRDYTGEFLDKLLNYVLRGVESNLARKLKFDVIKEAYETGNGNLRITLPESFERGLRITLVKVDLRIVNGTESRITEGYPGYIGKNFNSPQAFDVQVVGDEMISCLVTGFKKWQNQLRTKIADLQKLIYEIKQLNSKELMELSSLIEEPVVYTSTLDNKNKLHLLDVLFDKVYAEASNWTEEVNITKDKANYTVMIHLEKGKKIISIKIDTPITPDITGLFYVVSIMDTSNYVSKDMGRFRTREEAIQAISMTNYGR